MKNKFVVSQHSIFSEHDCPFWSDQEFESHQNDFKEEYFLFYSEKKQTYKNKPLLRAGTIIQKIQKNGKQVFCDLQNAMIEVIETQHVGQGLRITKHQQKIEFYGYIDGWFKELKKYCIQKQIKNQYTIGSKIGCGSYADVYKLIRVSDQKEFAVKIYDKQSDKFDKECAIKELDILRKMDHPNVMTILETFESMKYLFIVSELLTFGNLDDILARTTFSEEDTIKGVYRLLDALSAVHSKGIIHRDIKPENILFRKPCLEEIVISDFGLAEYSNPEGTYQYHRCGTPGNMAPEILQDKPYDYKVDVYGVGIIFYQMLTQGQNPFITGNYDETIQKNESGVVDFSIVKASAPVLTLLKAMLDPDQNKRITVFEAKSSNVFKKYNRQTIVIKRKRILQDQTVSSQSPRSTSIYQSPAAMQLSPPIPTNHSSKFRGGKNAYALPARLKSLERKMFSSPSSGGNSGTSKTRTGSQFKINVKINKTSLYSNVGSHKVL